MINIRKIENDSFDDAATNMSPIWSCLQHSGSSDQPQRGDMLIEKLMVRARRTIN